MNKSVFFKFKSKAYNFACFSTFLFSFNSSYLYADDVEFDSSFLQVHNRDVIDISHFNVSGAALPGEYLSSLYVNEQYISNINLSIKSASDKSTFPCVNKAIIQDINFDYERLPEDFILNLKSNECVNLSEKIIGSSVSFDSNESRLDMQIPQIYMSKVSRGEIDPKLWEQGINSALFDYNINGYNSESFGNKYQSIYASINTGVNLGAWYFRQNGNFNWSSNGEMRYNSLNAYALRDVPDWRSRLMIGQGYTKGRIFDSLPFSGVQLFSEDRMLPSSQRGYAPEIRGVAKTTARVVVRQSDQIIYDATVSPGEFLINDLYPTGFGGNLDVTVIEADGSEQYFSVPYTSMAELLRPDTQRFSFVAGQYRNDSLLTKPMFLEGTYQRGISNSLTTYGGFMVNPDYYSLQLGTAIGTDIGSFSFDVTQAYSILPDEYENLNGQSYQLKFNKNISSTGSNVSLAAFRFSTDGYLDYQSAMRKRDSILRDDNSVNLSRSKSRFVVTTNQQLPDYWGQFYLSGSFDTYWEGENTSKQYQAGYNNRYENLIWGLSINRIENDTGIDQTNYSLNFSIPLGDVTVSTPPALRFSMNKDDNGYQRLQSGVSDSFGNNNQFNYGITATHVDDDVSGDFNAGYVSPVTTFKGSYSAGQNYHGQSVGISGSMIGHSGGVTLSPHIGSTYALVEAQGAEGAGVSGYSGVKVDGNGYAIVPSLTPYEMNTIYIDPKGLDSNVELLNTSNKVVPNANAVVLVKYETKYGVPILINATNNGQPVPFGSSVFDSEGDTVGMVGQYGQLYARVKQNNGQLLISWGDTDADQCTVSYELQNTQSKHLQKFNLKCNG